MRTRILLGGAAAWWCVTAAIAAPPTAERLNELRAEGPAELTKLIAARDALFPIAIQQPHMAAPTPKQFAFPPQQVNAAVDKLVNVIEWNAAIDHVAGAKYSHVSGLYWYTDFPAAQAESAKQHKPLLSLRLLGNLTDELSCANSRFFRTLLYPNHAVAKELREHYILHWQSVRPAPIITIDFGDGRKIVRTITGNSIHYLFAPDGQLADALPGLYGPKAFLDRLEMFAAKCRDFAAISDPELRTSKWCEYRNQRIEAARVAWADDLAKVRSALPGVDSPALGTVPPGVQEENFWRTLGALRPEEAALDDVGRGFVTAMQPPAAPPAARLAMSKARVETPAMRVVRNLQGSIGADTARNEYAFRPQILAWMNASAEFRQVERLNEQVYAQLFLTPSNDPWLGLQTPDVFSALPQGGVIGATAGK